MALLGSGCARCGRPYPAEGIRVLAQRDEIAFVQLICFECQVQTLALVTGVRPLAEGADDEPGGADGAAVGFTISGGSSARPIGSRPAITDDDVLEMHAFLADYQGDMQGLLDREEPADGGTGGAEASDAEGTDAEGSAG